MLLLSSKRINKHLFMFIDLGTNMYTICIHIWCRRDRDEKWENERVCVRECVCESVCVRVCV